MMKNRLGIVIFISLILLLAGIAACNVEPRLDGDVALDVGFKSSAKGFNESLVDEITLTAVGPGIDEKWTFNEKSDKVVISLPEAKGVTFTLTLKMSDGPFRYYQGEITTDLEAGERKELSFDDLKAIDSREVTLQISADIISQEGFAYFETIKLTATGEGIDDKEWSLESEADMELVIDLPDVGVKDVRFELSLEPTTGPVAYYRGVLEKDLVAGEITKLDFDPKAIDSREVTIQIDAQSLYDLEAEEVRLKATGTGIEEEWILNEENLEVVVELPDVEVDDVLFELFVDLSSTNPSPVLTYRGARTANLTEGQEQDLVFDTVVPYDTKILVPDYGGGAVGDGSGPKIVQIDDMLGSSWLEYPEPNSEDFLPGPPLDIEIDNLGQIWVAYGGEIESPLQIKSEITGTATSVPIASSGIFSLAFDSNNDLMYYIDSSNTLYQISADLSPKEHSIKDPDTGSLLGIYPFGLAVDDEGYVYFAGPVENSNDSRILKFDPQTETILADTVITIESFSNTYDYPDLLYKDGYIYVTDKTGQKIHWFDSSDLTNSGSFGTGATSTGDTAEKEFFGPTRFIATRNKKIYVIDEYDDTYQSGTEAADTDRIVSFSDIEGSDWETYLPQEGEEDKFTFYYYS